MFSPLRGLLAGLLLATQATASGVQAAEKCIKSGELEADQVRYIETQLRVAALQCRDQRHAEMPMLYNSFILENRPYLVRTQKPLLSYLRRTGEESVASYIVGVANRVSLESTRVSQFCGRAMLAAELSAKTADPIKLLSLMPVSYERPAKYCEQEQPNS